MCGTSYDGVSFNDAMKSGRAAARALAGRLWDGADRQPDSGFGMTAGASHDRHVVLVTYGEPTTPAFIDQLVYSWRILLGLTRTVAPIPRPLLPVIALSRARPQADVDGGDYSSPLEPITGRRRGNCATR